MAQIVGYLPSVNHHHAAALSRKRGLDILKPEAHQPVAGLDNDDLYVPIAEDSQKGFAAAIQARASFLHGFHHPKTALGGELRQTGQLPIQVRFLLPGGNSGVQGHTGWLVGWRGVDNYRARGQLLGRPRQLASLP